MAKEVQVLVGVNPIVTHWNTIAALFQAAALQEIGGVMTHGYRDRSTGKQIDRLAALKRK